MAILFHFHQIIYQQEEISPVHELIGITATIFVVLSFTFTSEKKIRLVNIVGAILFLVYGFVIGALSIWVANGCLIVIHIYKLMKRPSKKATSDMTDADMPKDKAKPE